MPRCHRLAVRLFIIILLLTVIQLLLLVYRIYIYYIFITLPIQFQPLLLKQLSYYLHREKATIQFVVSRVSFFFPRCYRSRHCEFSSRVRYYHHPLKWRKLLKNLRWPLSPRRHNTRFNNRNVVISRHWFELSRQSVSHIA